MDNFGKATATGLKPFDVERFRSEVHKFSVNAEFEALTHVDSFSHFQIEAPLEHRPHNPLQTNSRAGSGAPVYRGEQCSHHNHCMRKAP